MFSARCLSSMLLTLAAVPATAQTAAPSPTPSALTWVFELGGDHGFNDLYTLYVQGDSPWNVGANTGLFLSGGITALPLWENRLRTRAMIGVKYTGQSFSNAHVDYYAFPLEMLETLELQPIRFGAGLYALLGPKLSGSGVASNITTSFNSTVGLEARAEWVFNRRLGVGLRYVWNQLSAGGSQSLGAPALGIVLSFNGAIEDS
jgi:hypothetical protein